MTGRNWMFVIAAYSVTWVVILGYFARLHRGLRRVQSAYDAAMAGTRTEER